MKKAIHHNGKLLSKLLPDPINPKTLPLSFQIDGKTMTGIPDSFCPTVRRQQLDSNLILYTITGEDQSGLHIRVEVTQYLDFDAVEYLAYFTNNGKVDTPILSDIRTVDCSFSGEQIQLTHSNGDDLTEQGYEQITQSIQQKIVKTPLDGTSCRGAFPYMRLVLNEDSGVQIAIGWPARWIAKFEPEPGGVHFCAGQRRCHMRLHPGETMRTPRVTFVAYQGNETDGMNEWRRWYFAHILPKENGSPLPPKLCLHVFEAAGMPEFTGADEQNQLTGLDAYLQSGLHPDIWWLDAGWYPCNGEWQKLGNWQPDPQRFPHGLTPIGECCDENDIQFLLWFEPERVWIESPLAQQHPEWLIEHVLPDGTRDPYHLLNLAIEECCDYVIEVVDRIVKESRVRIYRQDFNFDPAPCWDAYETSDRIGATENLHVQGYLRFWDELSRRNPGLLIDSCSSGGRRNDLETMRRAVALHYTDIGYGNHPIKQKQHRLMFEWIPYFRAHNMNWLNPQTLTYGSEWYAPDAFSYMAAFAPSMTDMTAWDADDAAKDLARTMIGIWRQVAPYMLSGDYYPLTICRKSAEDFYAMQFHEQKTDSGFFQILSNARNPQRHFILQLKALDPQAFYRVTQLPNHCTVRYTGRQLSEGVDFELDAKSAVVCLYQKEDNPL